jgi:hypothetical protein
MECHKCYKTFQYNYLLEKHKQQKNICNTPNKIIKNVSNRIIQIENEIKKCDTINSDTINNSNKKCNYCNYCNHTFASKYSLSRHINTSCENKKKIIEEKNKFVNIIAFNQEEINKDLTYKHKLNSCKKEINKINKIIKNKNIQSINNTNNINNINNGNIILNNSINIHINSFGKEDLTHITDDKYKLYIKNLTDGILNYIKDVHFSPDKPENHNICIPQLNSSNIAVYKNGQWNAQKKEEIINKLLTKKITLLDNKCNIFEDNNEIDDTIIYAHNECIASYFDENNKENKEKICKDVELLLYNNREQVDNYNNLLG